MYHSRWDVPSKSFCFERNACAASIDDMLKPTALLSVTKCGAAATATCANVGLGYACSCATAGEQPTRADVPADHASGTCRLFDPCALNLCRDAAAASKPWGTCTNDAASLAHNCDCAAGFVRRYRAMTTDFQLNYQGQYCEEVDECPATRCSGGPDSCVGCGHGNSCADQVNAYACLCDASKGFVAKTAADGAQRCECAAGYEKKIRNGNEYTCELIDTCGDSPCGAASTGNSCTNNGGTSYSCACASGWELTTTTRNGADAEGCSDVDDCAAGADGLGPCGNAVNACRDLGANRRSCTCVPGFTLAGAGPLGETCADNDECAGATTCRKDVRGNTCAQGVCVVGSGAAAAGAGCGAATTSRACGSQPGCLWRGRELEKPECRIKFEGKWVSKF
jgi:hypothetical protein